MLGLFGTLNLGARSLQTQQQGVEVAGHNLANVNNEVYARQRLAIQTSAPLPTGIGPEGTGAMAVAITQVRDTMLDQQIQSETSMTGFLQSQQTALQYAEATIGEQLQGSANSLLSGIADLNKQISDAEASGGTANDLRDLRQQKVEDLAKLVNIQPAAGANGAINISVDGQLLISGGSVQDTLQTYDAGGGQLLVRTATSGTNLTLTGGSIQGTIDARDTTLQSLQDGLDNLAAQLISQANTIYSAGYDLNGNSGANFFTGAGAGTIAVNATIVNDPRPSRRAVCRAPWAITRSPWPWPNWPTPNRPPWATKPSLKATTPPSRAWASPWPASTPSSATSKSSKTLYSANAVP